jgi:hypothetical protein
VNADVDSLHVKRFGSKDLVGYVYIVKVDLQLTWRHPYVFSYICLFDYVPFDGR